MSGLPGFIQVPQFSMLVRTTLRLVAGSALLRLGPAPELCSQWVRLHEVRARPRWSPGPPWRPAPFRFTAGLLRFLPLAAQLCCQARICHGVPRSGRGGDRGQVKVSVALRCNDWRPGSVRNAGPRAGGRGCLGWASGCTSLFHALRTCAPELAWQETQWRLWLGGALRRANVFLKSVWVTSRFPPLSVQAQCCRAI